MHENGNVLVDWSIKVKVATRWEEVEEVCLEDCIRVYQKPYQDEFYLERADGVDGIISYEDAETLYDNRRDIFEGTAAGTIHWNRHGDKQMEDAFRTLRDAFG